ncbi:MAG: arginine--tRNA ligase [Candidatus Omnitrophica bacterium]|nr:arginine--tRNA ligase [Candidatus Omnitrophota bacterium]
MKSFHNRLSSILEGIIEREFGLKLAPPLWGPSSKLEFGDLSSMVAMKLASKLKKNPLQIAQTIKACLLKEVGDEVERIEILKPAFINVIFSKQALIDSLNGLLNEGEDFFRQNIDEKVSIEFVSANPTGPLSIAHGRQAVVGDAIANILDFCGNEVSREYYVNDAGRQVDLLTESVRMRMCQINGEEFSIPEDGYHGEYVKDIAAICLKENPHDLREFVLGQMITLIKDNLIKLGVKFDSWISQTKIINDGLVKKGIQALDKNGYMYDKDGASWFASTKFGDDKDRVIQKANGELTYFASDIALHKIKAERGHKKLINLWGPDHHGYIARVKASMQALGYNENILNILIIQLVSIKTKERMSRRKGTAILLSDLVDDVGKDAARFYYLTRKNSSHLEFDIDLAKEKTFNNLLYYVQYGCARIESIFRKSEIESFSSENNKFLEEGDLELVKTLLHFFYCLENAYRSIEPVFVIEYLKNLSSVLHKFYENQRVLSDDKNVTAARLNLLKATKIVLHCALNLLGITPVEKM